MAIRTGSGGLKYPLPNQAEIQARQNAAAASAGGSASASAYGANRRYAGLKRRLQADAIQSGLDRQFRAQSQLEGQRFRASQQADEQRFRESEGQLNRDAYSDRQQALFDQQLALQQGAQQFSTERDQMRLYAGIEQGLRTGELELPPAAQRKLDVLRADRANYLSGKNITPEQREEADQQYLEKERGIFDTARRPQGPDATGRLNQGITYYDPQTGEAFSGMAPGRVPMLVDERGNPQEILQQPDTSKEDAKRQEAEQKLVQQQQKERESWIDKRADYYETLTDPKTKKENTRNRALELAAKDRDNQEAFFEQRTARQQPAQQSGAGQTAAQPPSWISGRGLPGQGQAPAAPPSELTRSVAGQMGGGLSARAGYQPATSQTNPPSLGQGPAALPTEDTFAKDWEALPVGGQLLGPDGKIYKKQK